MSLKQKTIKSVKWTAYSSIILSIFQVSQIIILTKFLSPSDFGLVAIILFIVNFSQNFIDFGISNAIISKQDISQKSLNSLYILNIIIGISLFFLIFLCSSFIANYYDDERLLTPIKLISYIFIIVPFGQQFEVLLKKQLDFKGLAQRDIISRCLGFIVTIVFAAFGFGVYSIVYGNMVYCSMSTILLIIKGRKIHSPKLYFNYPEIKPLLSFGFYQMGEKIINYLNKEIDVLIIGKFLGMEALGIYNIAKDFISKPYQLINPIITKVTFPIMAYVQNDVERVKKIYLESLKYLALVNSIIFLFCFFFSDQIVIFFFGEEWIQSGLILKILSIYMLIRSVGNPVGSLQLAMGRADLGFYWNALLLLIVPITVYLGKSFGIVGVTISLLLSQAILYYPCWKYMVRKLSPISFKEYNLAQYQFWISSSVSAGIAFLISHYINNNILHVMVGGVFSLLFYITFLYFLNKEIEVLIIKFLRRAKSSFNK